jgi:GT2 family glycosyltransferase
MTNLTMQVRDRFLLTAQALTSLGLPTLDMTITILDDRSEPRTRDLVEAWCGAVGAHYVRNDTPLGTGQLRNMVITESEKHFGRGRYLAPHDNDVFFCPGWLPTLVHCYENCWSRDFRMLGGYGHPYHLPIGDMQFVSNDPDHRVYEVQALATQSTFMSWDVWDEFGPYCDTPVDRTCQSEDVFLTNKLRAKGFKLGVVRPHLIHATALKNTFGEAGPGWELVKAECPEGVICE